MRPKTGDRVKLFTASATTLRHFSAAIRIFTICNILLALFNFLWFAFFRPESELPCVVVLHNSELHRAAEKGLLHISKKALPSPPWKTIEESPTFFIQKKSEQYLLMPNYIRAKGERPAFNKSITYTTQATHEFLFPHVSELCGRWTGPISISVYAPGSDFDVVNRKLAHLIRCDPCVAANVSFHIVYHKDHTPKLLNFPEVVNRDCGNPPNDSTNYRKTANLAYPINFLRNAARLQAETKYVLASDIELYPSENIIPRFIEMMETTPPRNARSVYTLPIFEVEKEFDVPRTKKELQKLYANEKAVFFHKYVCDVCQNFPNRYKWIEEMDTNASSIRIFGTTKRRKDKHHWEPIYIGTNDDPLYAEELSWEGQRDKMSQMVEMCLLDYDIHILNNGFLCHASGVKRVTSKDYEWRIPFMQENDAAYPKILSDINSRHRDAQSSLCL